MRSTVTVGGGRLPLSGRHLSATSEIPNMKNKKLQWGDSGAVCTHRAALNGALSPTSSQGQGTSIAHPDSKQRCERPADDTDNERAAHRRNERMSLTLDGIATFQTISNKSDKSGQSNSMHHRPDRAPGCYRLRAADEGPLPDAFLVARFRKVRPHHGFGFQR